MSSIFFLGATGYIGGGFTAALRKYRPDLKITALHRSPSHESVLRDFGVTPIQGTLQELDKIEGYSYESDIVINAASSFDLELTNAILRGMKRRVEEGKAKGVLIHVTGVASFVDGSLTGSYVEGKNWNDNNEDDIRGIRPVWSGAVDAAILKAGEEGYFDSWLICAGGVHGTSDGPIRKTGAKYVLNPALQSKFAFYIGEGSNVHAEVHINDLVALFLIVFKKATLGPAAGSPYGRFYMGSTKLTSMKSIATALGTALHQHGKVDQAEPRSLTVQETGRIGAMLACNMLVKSDRSLMEGWRPEGVTLEETIMKDMYEMLGGMV